MDGHTILSWNIPNLITVWIMGAILVALAIGAKRLQAAKSGN